MSVINPGLETTAVILKFKKDNKNKRSAKRILPTIELEDELMSEHSSDDDLRKWLCPYSALQKKFNEGYDIARSQTSCLDV